MLSLLVLSIILWIGNSQQQVFGPYYYPTGDSNIDDTFIVFGEYNATHFYMSITVTGSSWVGFGFAQSSGCTPSSSTCLTQGTDAIIFANYGGSTSLTAQEWTLGATWWQGSLHSKQDITLLAGVTTEYIPAAGEFEYSIYLIRPYNPLAYGDRTGYVLSYPLAGDFCWL